MKNYKENLIKLFKHAIDKVSANDEIFVQVNPGVLSHVVSLGEKDSIKLIYGEEPEIQFNCGSIKDTLKYEEYSELVRYFCNKKQLFIHERGPEEPDLELFAKYINEIK